MLSRFIHKDSLIAKRDLIFILLITAMLFVMSFFIDWKEMFFDLLDLVIVLTIGAIFFGIVIFISMKVSKVFGEKVGGALAAFLILGTIIGGFIVIMMMWCPGC